MSPQINRSRVDSDRAIALTCALPPGTPKDLILRRAFVATMRNGEFFAEVKKPRLDVDPVAGEELNRIINEAFKLDPPWSVN